MIETILNNNLETLLQVFMLTGVALTVAAGVFIAKITIAHKL